ncbi:MAG: F0F1 ATP synthase subunit A [Puniceicoccaceae bacterium]
MFTGVKKLVYRGAPLAGLLIATELQAVSLSPYKLIENTLFGLPITNSMVTSWVISLAIILAVRLMVGKPQLIPSAGQAVVENLLGGIRDIMEPIVGKHLIAKVFPLLIGFFTFILIHNWSGLLPGVGAFGFKDEHGHIVYWMRPGNADLNMTVALAIISASIGWGYFVLRYAGIKLLFFDLFGNKADPKEVPKAIYILLFPVFFGVGLIEVISILFRNVSLSFRLFGNVFGGENLLASMTDLAGWFVPIPFYFLEILIGGVQALVFTLLTAVYIGLICNHGDEEDHAH